MINFIRLDHIQICIPTGKEDEARNFYAGVLGLEEIPKPAELIQNGGLWYRVGEIQLHIGTEETNCKSKRHPAFEISEIDSVRSFLKNIGVKLKEEIEIPGIKRFSLYDPFGNRIELLEKI